MALTEMAPLVTRGWSPSISIPIFHIFVIPFQAYSLLVGRDSLSSRYQLEKLAGNFGAWGEKAGSEMPDIPCHPVLAHSLQHLERSWEFVVVADCSVNMSTTSTLQAPETTSNPFSQVGWEELSCGICTIIQCQWFPALPSRSSKKQYGCRGKAPKCQNLGLKEGNAKELVLPLSFLK